jgi:predicted DNA-binding protein
MKRKHVTTTLNIELIKKLKYLSADTDRPINDLLEEAIHDLLKKHDKKPKK